MMLKHIFFFVSSHLYKVLLLFKVFKYLIQTTRRNCVYIDELYKRLSFTIKSSKIEK